MKNIPLFWPYTKAKTKALKELSDTLGSRWWGQGPKVDKFEKEFGKMFGYKYPLFVNSGTSALELAYHLIGLKEGDEVIVPVLNCTAGQMGLIRRGVKIVFADIERNTFNIDPIDLERKISGKTKAIVAVNLGGIPVSDKIRQISVDYNLPLIIDAAQDHEPCPQEGDYICYSFQAIKHISTGDGGMLVLTNKEEYDRAKKLRWFGIDRELKSKKGWQAWERREMTFDIEEAGYKFQPNNIAASIGLAVLPDLKKVIKQHRKLAIKYLKELEVVDDIDIVVGGSCWIFGILTEQRDELAEYLKDNGVETNLVHLRNDIFEIFGGKRQRLVNMDWVEPRYLYLPLNPMVTEKDVAFICKKVREFFGY